MKIQSKILKSAELILLATGLGGVALSQGSVRNPSGGVSLEGDIHDGSAPAGGHSGQYNGPILDGGSVFVDLDLEERLVLTVEAWPVGGGAAQGVRREERKLRLAGGTPGNGGAIIVCPREPGPHAVRLAADSAVIKGVIGMDGSFVVLLPEFTEDVFVQGVEFMRLGAAYSHIFRLTPGGEISSLDPQWDAQAIHEAVERATSDMRDEPVKLRFFGAAHMGKISGFVDATVVLGRSVDKVLRESFTLYLAPALAQRTGLVGLAEDRGVTFYADNTKELAMAVEAVVMLDAFSGMNMDLSWARARLDALRAHPGVRPPDVDLSYGAEASGATPIAIDPQLARDKRPYVQKKTNGASRFNGTLRDAGTFVVEELMVDWQIMGTLDDPQRAHDKKPLPRRKTSGAGQFNGTIHDGGTIVLPVEVDSTPTWQVLGTLDKPQRAGDKLPPFAKKSGGAGRYTGPIGDAGTIEVPGEPVEVQPEITWEILGTLAAPERAGDKLPPFAKKSGGAGKFNGTIGNAGSVTVDLEEESLVADFEVVEITDVPQRASDKHSLPRRAGRFNGTIHDAGDRTVDLRAKHKGIRRKR